MELKLFCLRNDDCGENSRLSYRDVSNCFHVLPYIWVDWGDPPESVERGENVSDEYSKEVSKPFVMLDPLALLLESPQIESVLLVNNDELDDLPVSS